MDLWDKGHYVALVDDTEAVLRAGALPRDRTADDDTRARAYNARVLSGRIRQAVRGLTSREGGGSSALTTSVRRPVGRWSRCSARSTPASGTPT